MNNFRSVSLEDDTLQTLALVERGIFDDLYGFGNDDFLQLASSEPVVSDDL